MKSWKDRHEIATKHDKEYLGFYAMGSALQLLSIAAILIGASNPSAVLTIIGVMTLCGASFCFFMAGVCTTRYAFWMGHEEVDAEPFPWKRAE